MYHNSSRLCNNSIYNFAKSFLYIFFSIPWIRVITMNERIENNNQSKKDQFFLINKFCLLEQFQGHSKIEWKVQKSFHFTSLPYTMHICPTMGILTRALHLSQSLTGTDTLLPPRVRGLHPGSLGAYTLGFDKCMMTCGHQLYIRYFH